MLLRYFRATFGILIIGCQNAIKVPDDSGHSNHPSHAVPVQEHGQPRVLSLHLHRVSDHVRHELLHALNVGPPSLASAVALVVVSKHQEPELCELTGQSIVPTQMLPEAVTEENAADHGLHGLPVARVQLETRFSVGKCQINPFATARSEW